MKYYKIEFRITGLGGQSAVDEVTMQTARDLVAAFTVSAGLESFEDSINGIVGYAQQKVFDKPVLDEIVNNIPLQDVDIIYFVSEADYKDWNKTWEEQGFEPINVDNKCIIHDSYHISEVPKDIIDITIETKQAFGTGTHDTTRMIVRELLNMNLNSMNVLDCGCGTGILSLVAAKCGAKEIIAYDIDEWSVNNTIHNCEINNVTNIKVYEGTADALQEIKKKFNVVLANINRNILLDDMPKFKAVMADGATLVLSGFYDEDVQMLKDKAATLNLTYIKTVESNKWCMLVLKNCSAV